MRVLGRRVYWRWYGEVLLSGSVVLRMTGDAAKWLRPGDSVRLSTEFKKPLLGFDEYALWGQFPLWPPFAKDLEHVREGPLGGEAYRYLIDEFAAHLDVPTARRVALGLGRLCREAGITLVAATHPRPGAWRSGAGAPPR
jgi:ABC-type ATPase with predicted acetyltransferase domain